MSAEELRALWEALGSAEDWLGGSAARDEGWGGAKTERPRPDFERLAEELAAGGGAPLGQRAPASRGAEGPVSGSAPRAGAGAAAARSEGAGRSGGAGRAEAWIEADLAAMSAEVAACRACRLGDTRRNTAFGEGSLRPLVLVVGEGPGAEEDQQGRPFVGPAGRLLDRMLGAVGLSREENCYIANIVKCRPPGNRDRDPAPDEREACLPYLERQIELLRPQAILALGRVAAQALLDTSEGITRLRGRWFTRKGLPLLATYHPSALLRDEALKRPAWEDLKLLRERLSSFTAAGDAEGSGSAEVPGAEGLDPEEAAGLVDPDEATDANSGPD